MQEKLKGKFPDWVNRINKEEYNLILSDDLDSLFSCALLRYKFGCEVRGFVDWNVNGKQVLYSNSCIAKKKYNVGIDMAIESGKCFDNHVVMISAGDAVNEESANLNAINRICRSNYYDKFCGSTLVQIMSLYGANSTSFTDEQKMVLCSIDGLYIPYKIQKIDFSMTQRNYMKQLEFKELSDFMKYYCDRSGFSEFERVKTEYNLDGKIWVNDNGKLETDIDIQGLSDLFGGFDLSLSQGDFKEFKRLDKRTVNFNNSNVQSKDDLKDGLFNFVLVGKSFAIYS